MKLNKYHILMSVLFFIVTLFWVGSLFPCVMGAITYVDPSREGVATLFGKLAYSAAFYGAAAGVVTSLLPALFHKRNVKTITLESKPKKLKAATRITLIAENFIFYFTFAALFLKWFSESTVYLLLVIFWLLTTITAVILLILFRESIPGQESLSDCPNVVEPEGCDDTAKHGSNQTGISKSRGYRLLVSMILIAVLIFWLVAAIINAVEAFAPSTMEKDFAYISLLYSAVGLLSSAFLFLFHMMSANKIVNGRVRALKNNARTAFIIGNLLFYAAFAIRRLFWLRTVLMNAFLFFWFLANALGVTFLVLYRSRMKKSSEQNEKNESRETDQSDP